MNYPKSKPVWKIGGVIYHGIQIENSGGALAKIQSV
jgi:hypothetical protein